MALPLVLLCWLLLILHPEAYGKDSTATDFYFGCMRGIRGGGYIFVSTNSTDNVTYNMYYLNFVASGIATKTRPPAFTNFAVGEISSNTFEDRFKSIRVQSDQPVSVKLLDRRFISSEFVVLPCHEYQGVNQYEYYTVSTSSYSNISFSEALLVGCRNNTNITIIPSVDLFLPFDAQRNDSNDIMVLKGNSHTLTLHEGQTLLFGSNGGIDISGTHIISNKPLTVITGHECGSTSDMIANQICKYMHLQVPPTLTWGKQFILSDFSNRNDANPDYTEYVKIVTSQDDTTVITNCSGVTNTTKYSLNGAVGSYEFNISNYCYIEANKPILVVQFPHHRSYATMVLVTPMEQYLQRIDFDLNFYTYSKFVITAIPEGFSHSAIFYNNSAISNWTGIYDSSGSIIGYGATIEMDRGSHSYAIPSSSTIIHTDNRGKLSVLVQKTYYFNYQYLLGHPALLSLESNVVQAVCTFSCNNGECVADDLCQCFDGWSGERCDEALCRPVCANGYCDQPDTCICYSGWTGDRCRTDIDECQFSNICNQSCINTEGSYNCECESGYQLTTDNSTCRDINECETSNHNCTHFCHNTLGSYSCTCRAGYNNTESGNCTDIDECLLGISGCQQLCINTGGSYYCECNSGYILKADNTSCDDINECMEVPSVCPNKSVCVNKLGSYECNCISGYKTNGMGMCTDINECASSDTHSCSQSCINTDGSYDCFCSNGYIKRFKYFCFDINECSNSSLHNCTSNEVCQNTVGGFVCQCKEGFTRGNDGTTCELQPCHEILQHPVNGNVGCPTGNKTNDTCYYSCNIGFELIGDSVQRTCQSNGRWSGRAPYCSPVPCPTLVPPDNGYLQLPCPAVYQSECIVRCFDGYQLVSTNDTISIVNCSLDSTNGTKWSDTEQCKEKNRCDSNPCHHNGTCSVADNPEGFECNCTGTLYEGKTCDRSLILIDPIGTLIIGGSLSSKNITFRARPDKKTEYTFEGCRFARGTFNGKYFLGPCSFNLTSDDTMRTLMLTGYVPGSYALKLLNSDLQPVPFVISSDSTSDYFSNQFFEGVQPSCCAANTRQMCQNLPSVQLTSSCSWNEINQTQVTRGIVFIEYDIFTIPLSLAGVQIPVSGELSTMLPPTDSTASCSGSQSCPNLTPLNQLSSITIDCYRHMPTPADLSAFVQNQSLTDYFLKSVRRHIFPSWFNIDITNNSEALLRLSSTNYLAQLVSSSTLLTERGCQSLVVNTQGQYILLQHNGPLNLTIQNEQSIILQTPSQFNYYCIAVHVCLGQSSPLHIGLPPSAQDGIKSIDFISNYINKGWRFNFKSVLLRKTLYSSYLQEKIWNGFVYAEDSSRADIHFNALVNMEASGKYSYGMTSIVLDFNGFVRYKYVTKPTETNIALLVGDCTFTTLSKVNGAMEKLEFKKVSADISIYYNQTSSTSCSDIIPSNGVSFKLSYIPQQDQQFYLNVLELPFDTRQCPVDVFIHLNSTQDMNGLSFYSECLDISFDTLLFTGLAHKLYIPMSPETLCIKPVNFTSLFPANDFGLIIHSSLNASRLRYNSFIQILPGYDGTALSLGFSRDTDDRVGMIHSIEMTMFDSAFVTQVRLSDRELSFKTMLHLFNNIFYKAHIQGVASTSRQWKDMTILVNGWFAMENGSFMHSLERNVSEEIRKLGDAANTRKVRVDQQLANATAGLERATVQLVQAKEAVTNSSFKLNQTRDALREARNRLREAEMNVTSASDEVKEAEEAINNVCQQQTCPLECQNATRQRTVYQDTFYTAEGTCDSMCNATIRERIPPLYEPYLSWQYIVCCWDVNVTCDDRLCTTLRCSPVCKFLNSTRPVFNYKSRITLVPCKVSCPIRQYNATIERIEEYIDPCGKRVPNFDCIQNNSACESAQEASLIALNKKRSDLIAPLQERNRARDAVLVLEIRESEAENDLISAQESLTSAQAFHDSSTRYKAAVESSHDMILKDTKNDQQLYDLTQQHGDIVFNINNITFSVSVSEINNPFIFPITIIYNTAMETNRRLNYVYQFRVPFSSQKQAVVDVIVDIIRNSSARRGKRQVDEASRLGKEQFEIRCTQLKSIDQFVQHIFDTLKESEIRGISIQENLLDLIGSVEITLNATSVNNVTNTGNYTSLKELYGLTQEEIDESMKELGDRKDEVLDSVKTSYKGVQDEARSIFASLNSTLLTQWRSSIELLLQGNGTIAGRSCSGLIDCIIVLNTSLDNLLLFAPSDVSSVLSQRQLLASQLFLQLASNDLLTFTEARNKLTPINSIIKAMISDGYWCSTPPEITTHPVAKTSVQIGTKLLLTCTGNSSLPLTYQWRKDGVALPNTNNHTLALDDMQVFDEGNYSCEVTNNVGSIQSTNSSVHVFILPQFFQVPSSIITYIGDGNGAYFTCNSTSRPDPGWRWYHRSLDIGEWSEVIGEETNELLIRNPSLSDEGEYRCVTYNDFGELSSDPVSLRLLSVTAKVLVYSVEITMVRQNETAELNGKSLEEQVKSQFEESVTFGDVSLSEEISFRETFRGNLIVSFKMTSRNVTDSQTTPLQSTVNELATSKRELDGVRDELERFLESSEDFKLEDRDSVYQYSSQSFSVDIPEIHCPPGQELHSNRFLCSDCLEGQEQTMTVESRFTGGRTITERVPRCSLCPLNTHQSIVGGGRCKSCPTDHITFITGAVSVDQCTELCPVNYNSSNGLMPCKPCPKGTYQPRPGEVRCLTCTSEEDDPLCSNDPCEQPMIIGSCSQQELKFYYDKSQQQCQPFLYSGCDGNENNFQTLNECSLKCGCPQNESSIVECDADPCLSSTCLSAPTAKCFSDYCGNCTSRYYFNEQEVTDTCSCSNGLQPVSCVSSCLPTCQIPEPACSPSQSCVPGCGCPDDTVYDQTEQRCVSPSSCDTCSLPPNPGTCQGVFPRWFYNSSSERCELFSYGGCSGNANRFTSLQQCIQSCGCGFGGIAVSCSGDLCRSSICEAHDNSVCEIDSCSNCTVEHYVGLKKVTEQCDNCVLPPDAGPCNGSVNRWYFNQRSGQCENFTYGGCQGNGNNFATLSNCLKNCVSGNKRCNGSAKVVECYSDPCLNSHCPNFDNALCIPNHCGECSAHYYNSTGHDITMICSDCPADKPPIKCLINPCDHKTCPNLPPTECVLDVCGECKALYYWNNVDVTEFCMTCPAEGQIFKDCGGSCERTCDDIVSQKPFVCSKHYCVPGCACPAGQVLDETNNRCVYAEQCPCQRSCDPIRNNCTNVSYDNCNCPLCRDCPITGQEYDEVAAQCPKTCTNPHLLCVGEGQPGCSCPKGQLIDEMNNRCVHPDNCPKSDPCTLAPEAGPCTASITRFYYNVTTQTCQQFSYGGCFPNENNFFTQHDCEEKCSDCYPMCTPEYCAIKRGATCSVPSSRPGSTKGCPGGCALSNCGACYYSYNDLPLPPLPDGCPSVCPLNNDAVNELCMTRWGRCVQRSYFTIYKPVSERERFKDNFRCWPHQCTGN